MVRISFNSYRKISFTRTDLQIFLEKNGIQTRVIFTGNILRQPAFKNIKNNPEDGYPIADRVMERGLLIANHHGLTDEMTNYLYDTVNEFLDHILLTNDLINLYSNI